MAANSHVFADYGTVQRPEGHDVVFTTGVCKRRTLFDVLHEFPRQYLALRKSKSISAESQAFVTW
eukprot:2846721-Lingulodinium_polyedra.AAC.1